MNKLMTVVFSVIFMAGLSGAVIAGSINSTGPPSAGSGMYTLSDIYYYLTEGEEATSAGSFQGPSAPPGSTMMNLKTILDDFKNLIDQCDLTIHDIPLGKTAFITQTGNWGPHQYVPTPTPTPIPWTQTTCEAYNGYWAPKNDGTGDYGCWFVGGKGETCNYVCGTQTLVCDPGDWNDDASCTICDHLKVDDPAHGTLCNVATATQDPSYFDKSHYTAAECRTRAVGATMTCEAPGHSHVEFNNAGRFCVCEPQ